MMPELKPCPFCGRLPNIIERKQKITFFTVECKNVNCKILVATLPKKTVEEAIEAWNMRAKEDE